MAWMLRVLEVGSERAIQFNSEYTNAFGKPPLRDVRSFC
jgi:hypothetical protein